MAAIGINAVQINHVPVAILATETINARETGIARLMLTAQQSSLVKTSMAGLAWYAGTAKFQQPALGPQTALNSAELACLLRAMIRATTVTTQGTSLSIPLLSHSKHNSLIEDFYH